VTERRDFLVELGTEELPPKALAVLSQAFGDELARGLRRARLEFASSEPYATPRRLAVRVRGLTAVQPDSVEERRGPALTAAFDGRGNPTPAALGFARSCGVDIDGLDRVESDKGAWLVFRRELRGRTVNELLPGIVAQALGALPIPRRMRWGDSEESFVRPVHWLVMLYGPDIVPATLFGLPAGRSSRGHRFLHPAAVSIPEPEGYAPLLEAEGRVIAEFARRRDTVRARVLEAAAAAGARAEIDPALLDEVTGMVEWPVALVGHFEERFLDIPEEALISVMRTHQKYFHLRDAHGHLLPGFVTVSNIESRDPAVVRAGNERVIRPRLSDGMFFWTQDRGRPLSSRLDGLRQVVFQRGLGTMHQKSERLSALAGRIAARIGGSEQWAARAGWLAKCDLATDMVGEFPELQGIMGRYYAAHDGEPAEVAQALAEQYQPRSAADGLPEGRTGQALAIADKLDALVGLFGIGSIPSGDKDPFALRRAALGIVRIAIEHRLPLDLFDLIEASAACYGDQSIRLAPLPPLRDQLYDFMMDRLRVYYQEQGIGADAFEAVLARRPGRPADFDARVRAVELFRALPEAESLASANKRIGNILRKAADEIPDRVDPRLLTEPAEKGLASAVEARRSAVEPLVEAGDYAEVLKRLAGLRPAVDEYFDKVLVMSEDAAVRRNRLAQLNQLRALFLGVADLSLLSVQAEPRDPQPA
jgi:glycyl-tRNA synthetase beta chain